jgi:glycosyltransferase involved in cell wall biosynthesis
MISVLIPTFNEEENVVPLSEAIINVFEEQLPTYNYEIIFIDNDSVDKTREKISSLCAQNSNIKAIFNAKNFGQFNSPFYGLCQTSGDCTILMCADFQDPVYMIPRFVSEWENGCKIVCGIKTTSQENSLMYFIRTCYYKLIKRLSDIEQIEHFTGFGLYDKSFIEVLKNLKDPTPFLRGIVAELGARRKDIPYEQAKRRSGKTSNNWYRLYDAAMLSFTSYTKIGLRLATISGFIFSGLSLLVALIYLICKLLFWQHFPMGVAPVLIGVFVIGSLQLFFIGLLGEYILNINSKIMNRPLVIEEKRLNFRNSNVETVKQDGTIKSSA